MLGEIEKYALPTKVDVGQRYILSISCGEDWAAVVTSQSESDQLIEVSSEKARKRGKTR